MEIPDDHELMARVKTGDERAYELLYERHRARALSHAVRMLGDPESALDVFQDAFLYVFRLAPDYRPEARFTTLLYRAVRSLCLDRLARKERRLKADMPDGLPDPRVPDPSEAASAREEKLRLERAVESLPAIYREVVSLRLTGGLSNEEIADILDVPLGTVKSRIHYAMAKLREALAEPERL